MYPEDLYQDLKNWSESGLFLMRELLPLIAPVSKFEGWKDGERRQLGFLLTACTRSAESALLLTAYGQMFDAELQTRAVMEGSVKFAYILQDHAQFATRFREYVHDCFQVALLKDHRKAVDLLTGIPNADAPEWRPIRERLLSDEELASLDRAYPPAYRRSLEGRWGFTAIIRSLEKSGDPLFQGLTGLGHGYASSSHHLHMDYAGVATYFERDLRSAERRDALHRAHAVRIISDVFSALWIRLNVGYRFVGADPTPLPSAVRKVEEMLKSFGSIYSDWLAQEYGSRS